MKILECEKCGEDTQPNCIEVFGYNSWNLCSDCEILFFEWISDFFKGSLGDGK